MIVLEHIPIETVTNLKNIHIVEEFFDGNALIQNHILNKNKPNRRLAKTGSVVKSSFVLCIKFSAGRKLASKSASSPSAKTYSQCKKIIIVK
jgi:hypothetical protein